MRVPSARMHALQCVSFVCFGGMSTAGKSTETPLGNIPALKTKVQDKNICSIPKEIQVSQIIKSNQHDKLNEERVQVSKRNSFRKNCTTVQFKFCTTVQKNRTTVQLGVYRGFREWREVNQNSYVGDIDTHYVCTHAYSLHNVIYLLVSQRLLSMNLFIHN